MTRYIAIILFLTASALANHQVSGYTPADSTRSKNKSDYIERLDTLMLFKIGLTNDYESFQQEGDDFYYDIRPNIPMVTRLSFNYRFVSFGVKFKSPLLTETADKSLKGNTDHFGLGFKFSFGNWIQDLHYSTVKGFYVHNTDEVISGWDEGTDPYIQIPDLDVFRIGGSTTYKLNPRFSFKAISSQTEVQLKSCGSFAASLLYDLYYIKNKTVASSEAIKQESTNLDFILSASYYYTYVINKKLYAAAGLTLGGGIVYSELETSYEIVSLAPETSNYTNPMVNAKAHAGIGYNVKRFVAGAEISYSDASHKESNTNVSTNYSSYYFQVFFGVRITAPKILRKLSTPQAR